jgi:cell division protease FtsH
LDSLVLELIEKETLTKDDMARICAGVAKRPNLAPYNGFGKRTPSEQPPVLTPAERARGNGSATDAFDAEKPLPVGDAGAPQSR